MKSASGSTAQTSAARRPGRAQPELTLSLPFHGYGPVEVALLLRFIYCPEDATPENFRAVAASVPGLLRLAHALEAGRLLPRLEAHLVGERQGAGGRNVTLCILCRMS